MFGHKTRVIEEQALVIDQQKKRIQFLEAVVCPEGHDWVKEYPDSYYSKKCCRRCGRIEQGA